MTAISHPRPSRRILEPHDRISEVLFGLIMALTFTGSLSVADAGRDDVRAMLVGALGCNIAWGIIDGVFYLMGCLSERGAEDRLLQALRASQDPEQSRQLLREALPNSVAAVATTAELDALKNRLGELTEAPEGRWLTRHDWLGAIAVFAWVFLVTLPVAVPFMLWSNVAPAMRISNLIAVVMLFFAGLAYGRHLGRSPWLFGLCTVVLGSVLVALTMALGG